MQSQIVCHGCRSVLLYPRGAPSVCCAVCHAVTSTQPPGMEMAQLICGGCRTLLMHTRNATTVRCSCCDTVNLVRPVSSIAHVNCGQCQTVLMYPYGAPSVKCAICNFITNIGSMDLEHGKKPSAQAATCTILQLKDKLISLQPLVLRASALLATTVAAVVMGLNKQSYTAVVAIVGTNPITQTFTAQFKDTPAFVYFVIANAIASLYNLVVLVMRSLLQRKTHSLVGHLFDMVIMVLLATGAATAASMAELGKNGNLHTRWNLICDKFGSFCNRGGLALVSSFIGVALMLALNLLSAAANSLRANVAGQ